jgi:hypothetical protein
MNGHWFCSFCKCRVVLPAPHGRWDARRGVRCPTCENNSAVWINTAHKLTSESAFVLFAQFTEAVQ